MNAFNNFLYGEQPTVDISYPNDSSEKYISIAGMRYSLYSTARELIESNEYLKKTSTEWGIRRRLEVYGLVESERYFFGRTNSVLGRMQVECLYNSFDDFNEKILLAPNDNYREPKYIGNAGINIMPENILLKYSDPELFNSERFSDVSLIKSGHLIGNTVLYGVKAGIARRSIAEPIKIPLFGVDLVEKIFHNRENHSSIKWKIDHINKQLVALNIGNFIASIKYK